jgi:hypothetical protein
MDRTNCLLSFDKRTAQKKKKLSEHTTALCLEMIGGGAHRQQGYLISLISLKDWREYTERWTDRNGYTERRKGGIIRLFLFFKIKEGAHTLQTNGNSLELSVALLQSLLGHQLY